MNTDDAADMLQDLLRSENLDVADPDPWRVWKVFKRFLALPADSDDSVASFQCTVRRFRDGESRLSILFVRQFSFAEHGWFIPDCATALELNVRVPGRIRLQNRELWSFEFDSLSGFASEVESLTEFQAAANGRVLDCGVYTEDFEEDWDD